MIPRTNITDNGLSGGPRPASQAEQTRRCEDVIERLLSVYGHDIESVFSIGSIAQGTTHAYSDIDLICVLKRRGYDRYEEWLENGNKVEVAIRSEHILLDWSKTVTRKWPFNPGTYLYAKELYGEGAVLPRVIEAVLSPPDSDFDAAIRDLLIGGAFGFLGKLRGLGSGGASFVRNQLLISYLEAFATVVAIAERHCFRSRLTYLDEILDLKDLPGGLPELAAIAQQGCFDTGALEAADLTWTTMIGWLEERKVDLSEALRRRM